MVADVVDHRRWSFPVGDAEAAAELLQPEDAGLGGAQHHDGVDVGQVDALVEHVDREDDIEIAALSCSRRRARGALSGPEWTATARMPCSRRTRP